MSCVSSGSSSQGIGKSWHNQRAWFFLFFWSFFSSPFSPSIFSSGIGRLVFTPSVELEVHRPARRRNQVLAQVRVAMCVGGMYFRLLTCTWTKFHVASLVSSLTIAFTVTVNHRHGRRRKRLQFWIVNYT